MPWSVQTENSMRQSGEQNYTQERETGPELSFKSCQPGDVALEHRDIVKSERQEFTRARGENVSSSRPSGVQQENLSLACLSEEEDLWRTHWNFTDSKEKVGIQASDRVGSSGETR